MKRYHLGLDGDMADMYQSDGGDYISYDDYLAAIVTLKLKHNRDAELNNSLLKQMQEQVVIIAKLQEELERERMRLAGCGVAAMSNTPETVKERITPDNPYYSASYGDVCRAVDREMKLQEEVRVLREALESIANPLAYLQKIAKKAGLHMHGSMAIMLSQDSNYLRDFAEQALSHGQGTIKEYSHERDLMDENKSHGQEDKDEKKGTIGTQLKQI